MNYQYPNVFARFYDTIYHQLRDGIDNNFFLSEIKKVKGPVLEIGVGTGRFFIDALNQNADIYGIDISNSMLDVLNGKLNSEQQKRVSCQSIVDFSFDKKFDLIIAPFRVMMHITDKNEQIKAINNVYKHLKPTGKFIFDTFIPDLKQLINGLENVLDFDGEYESGKKLKRFASTKPELINQLINVNFRFEWTENEKDFTEDWIVPLRFFFRYELEHLIERTNFKKYIIYGDYQNNLLTESSKEFVVECIKL
jgi:SAM-dependent methyltransferase